MKRYVVSHIATLIMKNLSLLVLLLLLKKCHLSLFGKNCIYYCGVERHAFLKILASSALLINARDLLGFQESWGVSIDRDYSFSPRVSFAIFEIYEYGGHRYVLRVARLDPRVLSETGHDTDFLGPNTRMHRLSRMGQALGFIYQYCHPYSGGATAGLSVFTQENKIILFLLRKRP